MMLKPAPCDCVGTFKFMKTPVIVEMWHPLECLTSLLRQVGRSPERCTFGRGSTVMLLGRCGVDVVCGCPRASAVCQANSAFCDLLTLKHQGAWSETRPERTSSKCRTPCRTGMWVEVCFLQYRAVLPGPLWHQGLPGSPRAWMVSGCGFGAGFLVLYL